MSCGLYSWPLHDGTLRYAVYQDEFARNPRRAGHLTRVRDAACGTRVYLYTGEPIEAPAHVVEDDAAKDRAAKKRRRRRDLMASWLDAEQSLAADGPVSDETFAARVAECRTCPHLRTHRSDPVGYCGECGCGAAARAMLTIKGRMPRATCPLDPPRWGHAPGTGATTMGRVRQAIGVAANVVDMAVGRKRRRERQAVAARPRPETENPNG